MRDSFFSIKDALFFRSRTEYVTHFLTGKKVKLLDVGNLGDGKKNVDIEKIIKSNKGEYFGLDVNKNLADKLGVKNQYIGDLHNLSGVVADKTFDYVYAGEIIEHSWKPGEIILECSRILKDGGYLILDTPNVFSYINVFRMYFKGKDSLGDVSELTYNETKDNFSTLRDAEKRLLTQPQHKIFYGPAMLRQLLNMHGFKIENIAFIGKTESFFARLFMQVFPQAGQKIGIVARKADLEEIFF